MRFADTILEQGLLPMSRQYVHLSTDMRTAINVGTRHGRPSIFTVSAQDMHRNGIEFFKADNGVWLTKNVPVVYLRRET